MGTVRIAVLGDIHGNLPALEAVLERLDALRPDRVACIGDVVVGATDSAACWRLLRGRGIESVRGNHERYLLAAVDGDPAFATEQWAPVRWAAAQLEEGELAELRRLPLARRPAGAPGLLTVHASPRDDYDHLSPATPQDEWLAMFGGVPERTVVRGHNHLAFERRGCGRHVIALGSVGLSLDGSATAQFAWLEPDPDAPGGWRATHERLRYDVDAAVRRFRDSGYLEAAGPMARLFLREVATGTHQLIPFMRHVRRWRAEAPELPLEAALERFLTMY